MANLDTTVWLCGPPPATGQHQRYPGRFLFNLRKHYPFEGKKVLSMFSGSSDIGTTTDMRQETGADIVAPYDAIPLPPASFDYIIADPPYTAGFGFQWSKDLKDLPKPGRVLEEAARLSKKNGVILILHILVLPAYKRMGVERIGLHPILCGPNNVIRVLNVFRKVRGPRRVK